MFLLTLVSSQPYFYDDSSIIQREMGAFLKGWINGQSQEDKAYILNALTKDSVRNHKNRRKGHAEDQVGHGCGGQVGFSFHAQLRVID